jgi:DNA primase
MTTTPSKSRVRAPVPADIPGALTQLGLDYAVTGDDAKILCPWHDDRKPSCYVQLQSGVVHCFSCGEKGQFVKLVRTILGGSEDRAALWCQTRAGSRLRPLQDREEALQARLPRMVTEADLALFTDPPADQLQARRISLASARELGILWDQENARWIIPMRDPDGTLVGWQEKGRKHHDERNHPRKVTKPLFGLRQAVGPRAVLVESPLDVARLRAAGIRCGVSSFGVYISASQLGSLVTRFEDVVFALDNDLAGWDASEELRVSFRRIPARFFNYGDSTAKDPGDMSDAEIRFGIDNAVPSLVMRF